MIDVDTPRGRATLMAAPIEDAIYAHLLAWREAAQARVDAACDAQVTRSLLPQLHHLNVVYFAGSPAIARTLEQLAAAVESGDAESALRAYARLQGPGDNFGTWAI